MYQAARIAQVLSDSHRIQTPLHTPTHSPLLSQTPVVETPAISAGWNQQTSNDEEWNEPTVVVDTEFDNEPDSTSLSAAEPPLPKHIPFFERLILGTKYAITYSLSRIMSSSIDVLSGSISYSSLGNHQTMIHWLEAYSPLWINRHFRLWASIREQIYRRKPESQRRIEAQRGDLGKNRDEIPDYVLEHAPFVHLFSGEQFWPCDAGEHLVHTTPYVNYTVLGPRTQHPSLSDLDELNFWHGRFVFLTSDDDPEDFPAWLRGEKNIPSSLKDIHQLGSIKQGPLHDQSHEDLGKSDASSVLVVVDKGQGIVDAFWFYFYSFNLGNKVLNIRFGNHVGDWEHSVVRFHNGTPKSIFLSEHSSGAAYTYEAVEKRGKRPVIYSATGSHAMYATPGIHPYVLPWGLLHDQTDRGPLWDPALNFHGYTYDSNRDTLRASNLTRTSPTEWFYFAGHWGDKAYPLSDRRQYEFAGQYHYVGGPLGPRFKDLGRRHICPSHEKPCIIRNWIGDTKYLRPWPGMDEDQKANLEGLI